MPRVVILDDDPVVLELAGDLLREAGHQVRVAKTATDLLQKLLTEPADVLILDVNMPEISGGRVAGILRKSLAAPFPRILLFSGLPAPELRRLARRLKVTGWVKKGCPKAQLLAAVDAASKKSGDHFDLADPPALAPPEPLG